MTHSGRAALHRPPRQPPLALRLPGPRAGWMTIHPLGLAGRDVHAAVAPERGVELRAGTQRVVGLPVGVVDRLPRLREEGRPLDHRVGVVVRRALRPRRLHGVRVVLPQHLHRSEIRPEVGHPADAGGDGGIQHHLAVLVGPEVLVLERDDHGLARHALDDGVVDLAGVPLGRRRPLRSLAQVTRGDQAGELLQPAIGALDGVVALERVALVQVGGRRGVVPAPGQRLVAGLLDRPQVAVGLGGDLLRGLLNGLVLLLRLREERAGVLEHRLPLQGDGAVVLQRVGRAPRLRRRVETPLERLHVGVRGVALLRLPDHGPGVPELLGRIGLGLREEPALQRVELGLQPRCLRRLPPVEARPAGYPPGLPRAVERPDLRGDGGQVLARVALLRGHLQPGVERVPALLVGGGGLRRGGVAPEDEADPAGDDRGQHDRSDDPEEYGAVARA